MPQVSITLGSQMGKNEAMPVVDEYHIEAKGWSENMQFLLSYNEAMFSSAVLYMKCKDCKFSAGANLFEMGAVFTDREAERQECGYREHG